mgnify:CR=1 FL=1
MERNAGYEIKRLLLYDDNKGFALGENLRAPDPYVTWKVTEEQGRRSFDWGHYFTTERAAVKDFLKRAGDYEKENSVFLASEGPQPDSFKYYSTQRPIDIGTFPKGGGNDPIRFQNYDKRLPVEGGAFLAWGHLTYTKPLTEKQAADYELQPAPVISELRRESGGRPRPIAEQLKAAQREAQEQRAPDAPKKKAPDRGDR